MIDNNSQIWEDYLDGMTMRDIAMKYEISKQAVSLKIQRVRKQKSKALYNRYLYVNQK